MPFSYPKSLTAGTPENVNDLNTNLTAAAADWEYGFSTYKIITLNMGTVAGAAAGFQMIGLDSNVVSGAPTLGNNTRPVVWLDPTDFAVQNRTVKYRLRALCVTNQVAPAISFTVGLYPVSSLSFGTSGQDNVANLSPVVTGSTVAFTTPAAAQRFGPSLSGDFTAPAANWYVLAVNTSGTQATGSVVDLFVALQYRQT